MITPRQFDVARQYAWIRAAYFHDEMVRRTLADADISTDDNTREVRESSALESSDAVIGDDVHIDVIPETGTSRRAHLFRESINDAEQMISYEPADSTFLAEIFEN